MTFCNDVTPTVCESCSAGVNYSSNSNPYESCRRVSECSDDKIVVKEATTVSDTECDCRRGYSRDSLGVCHPDRISTTISQHKHTKAAISTKQIPSSASTTTTTATATTTTTTTTTADKTTATSDSQPSTSLKPVLATGNTATADSVSLSSSLGAVVGVSVVAAVFIVIVASIVVAYKVSRKNVMPFGKRKGIRRELWCVCVRACARVRGCVLTNN